MKPPTGPRRRLPAQSRRHPVRPSGCGRPWPPTCTARRAAARPAAAPPADLDCYLERLVLVCNPRAVVISTGRQRHRRRPVAATGRGPDGYDPCRGSAPRLPAARVYVISISRARRARAIWPQAQANSLLAALCATDARYTYVNAASVLLGSMACPDPSTWSTSCTLNAAGYQAWTSAIRRL